MLRFRISGLLALMLILLLINGCSAKQNNANIDTEMCFELKEKKLFAELQQGSSFEVVEIKSKKPVYGMIADLNQEKCFLYGVIMDNPERISPPIPGLYMILLSESDFQTNFKVLSGGKETYRVISSTEEIDTSDNKHYYVSYIYDFLETVDAAAGAEKINVIPYDEKYVTDSVRLADQEHVVDAYLTNVVRWCIGDKDSVTADKNGVAIPQTVNDQELVSAALEQYLQHLRDYPDLRGEQPLEAEAYDMINIPCYELKETGAETMGLYRMYALTADGHWYNTARVYYSTYAPFAAVSPDNPSSIDESTDPYNADIAFVYTSDASYLFDGKRLLYDKYLSSWLQEDPVEERTTIERFSADWDLNTTGLQREEYVIKKIKDQIS